MRLMSNTAPQSNASLTPLAVTPGEPAGIGPDISLAIALAPEWERPLVAIGDPNLLALRADRLGLAVEIETYDSGKHTRFITGRLPVIAVPLRQPSIPGRLDPHNAAYVLETLDIAAKGCLKGHFAGLVTGPVHKGVINDSGRAFSGHTEYLADHAGAAQPVMMLAAPSLRVALVTTHLPLAQVSKAITRTRLDRVIRVLHTDLVERFDIAAPRILVCGLNPHAGESGHLGREEIEIIEPALKQLRESGIQLEGPLPADTAFTPAKLVHQDAVLAMYHDQGLPVLKHAGFGEAVNITLGLPFIRTSVDHGTALDLAGSGRADSGSMVAATRAAMDLARSARH